MSTAMGLLFLSCLLAILHNFPVLSISCTQCTPRDPGCDSGAILPSTCVESAHSCFLYNLYFDEGQGTFRGCTDKEPETEGCSSISIGARNGVACTRLCDWDGCNSHYGNVLSMLGLERK